MRRSIAISLIVGLTLGGLSPGLGADLPPRPLPREGVVDPAVVPPTTDPAVIAAAVAAAALLGWGIYELTQKDKDDKKVVAAPVSP